MVEPDVLLTVVLCSAPAELNGLRLVLSPGGFLPAKLDGGVAFDINRLLQQFLHFRDTLIHAFRVEIVNFIGRLQGTEKNVTGDRVSILRIERVDVLLGKKEVTVIEEL